MMLLLSSEALSSGNWRRAATAARVMNGSQVRPKPYAAWNCALWLSRMRATLVMSTRWMVVTCAEVRLDITMCSAILMRIVLIGSMRVLACPAGGSGTFGSGAAGAAGGGGGVAGCDCDCAAA